MTGFRDGDSDALRTGGPSARLSATESIVVQQVAQPVSTPLDAGEPLSVAYGTAVASLGHDETVDADALVGVVMMREELAGNASAWSFHVDALRGMESADQSLRDLAEAGRFRAHQKRLASLRQTIGADADRWWLRLDELASAAVERASWLWIALAGLFFALSVSLTTDIVGRFLKDGPDFLSMLAVIAQAVIALLTGAAFSKAGSRKLGKLLERMSIDARAEPRAHLLLAIVGFVVILLFYRALPAISRLYSDKGYQLQKQGSTEKAIDSYRRAIALDPDSGPAHYNLGVAYELLAQPDRAGMEYRAAALLEGTRGRAENNLARLLIVEGKNVASALEVLDHLIHRFEANPSETPRDERYAAYKNRGWSFLQLKEPYAAEADLQRAVALDTEGRGASAHCLLAKLYADVSMPWAVDNTRASKHWEQCLALSPADPTVMGAWIVEAQRYLRTGS